MHACRSTLEDPTTATQNRGVGYRAEGLAIVQTDPGYAGYDAPRALVMLEDLRRRIAALPGVDSVFVTAGLPVDGQFDKEFRTDGATDGDSFETEGRWAGPGYFHTLEIPVLFGRVFEDLDSPETPEVIVVSEAFARHFFGTPDAVGKRLRFPDSGNRPVQIIGVVGNARSIDRIDTAPRRTLYRSSAQAGAMPTTLVARASQDEAALLSLVRQEVRRLRPELPVTNAMTMKQRQAKELAPFHMAVTFLGVLGGLGLLLASVGLYAVVAYAVSQRTGELGIRIALGARPGDLTLLVVRDVTALVLAGITVGSALSWGAFAVLRSSASQIVGLNLLALTPVALIIAASGAAAAYVPARRAVRTDPVAAIRHQ